MAEIENASVNGPDFLNPNPSPCESVRVWVNSANKHYEFPFFELTFFRIAIYKIFVAILAFLFQERGRGK